MKANTCGGYLLTCIFILCAGNSAQATDRGTLEFGVSGGATRFGEFGPDNSSGYDYTLAQVRAGLFLERKFSLELGLRVGAKNGRGIDLSFLYHFKLADGGSSIYFGMIGSRDNSKISESKKSRENNPEQFAIGGLLGLKTLNWPINPRLDIFWQRRFGTEDAEQFPVYGARLGFSFFFESFSPWDK